MIITAKHIEMARKAGACSINYAVGEDVRSINQNDMDWIAYKFPRLTRDAAKSIVRECGINVFGTPHLNTLCWGYGYGYGDGNGYGYGNGNGNGYGDGNGNGYGNGNSYGYGYGDGDGNGDGYGDGNGYGNGDQ